MIDKARRKNLKTLGLTASIPLFASLGLGFKSVLAASGKPTLPHNNIAAKRNWLVGGTNLITSDFPKNTIFTTNAMCSVEMTEARILGPCYFSVNSDNDISSGLTGLPMMLCLQLVNKDCEPLADYEIEVWHCDIRGVYSADTSESEESDKFSTWQCAGMDRAAKKSTWYRGNQITDSYGRVNFKTCFPGWYRGRSIHVHVRVKSKESVSLTTQFCFDESLTTEICTSHEKYLERGLQDTPLAKDRFFRRNLESSFFETDTNADGSLLAYKTLQIS